MKRLLKRKCVVIIWKVENVVRVVGVFKNEKLAQNYIKWLGDKHVERYFIKHAEIYDYREKEEIVKLEKEVKK